MLNSSNVTKFLLVKKGFSIRESRIGPDFHYHKQFIAEQPAHTHLFDVYVVFASVRVGMFGNMDLTTSSKLPAPDW